jgi:hypothetical protein
VPRCGLDCLWYPPGRKIVFTGLVDWVQFNVEQSWIGLISAALVGWVAVIYLAMAFGVRPAYLVFSGRHVGRLPAEKRWWGAFYGIGLIASGFFLLETAGAISTQWIADSWARSAGFAVAAVLGVATIMGLAKGSTWERMLFVPITLLGSGVAALLTFA